KFANASQSLDKLIGSQITDNSKSGLGYVSYNVVPPPHTGRFSPSRIDLSHTGLPEFAKPSVKSYGVIPIEVVTQTSSVEISALVKETIGAPLIAEWESDDEDKVEPPPEKERKNVKPSVNKVEVEIPKQNDKPARRPARCKYHQRERMVNGTNHSRVNHNTTTVPKAMLIRTGLKPVNSVRPVNLKRNLFKQINTAKEKVNTTRPNSVVLNAVRANKGKAGHSHKQIEDQGHFDSGCSRHMTGNISYLTDFKEFDGGYVAFKGRAKGGKITGKCTIRTGKLNFEDVYFVKELQFNLFSASQINNMYSVDMKNIIPKKDLTCLVANATNDESMLWHMRLSHINFKNINKLVKDNLVRGLPSKRFENDQTCVAYLKGKQHKVSFKSKIQNYITQSLFMLHKDLFGLTFNRVLVVKPHFKTPYELFRGIKPTLSFMRPFGCQVTILNTLDHLEKFDGKSDEGFFVCHSTNSKAIRVYNTRTRKVEENLHIEFLENKPLIACDGPKWLFNIDTLIESINYVPVSADSNGENSNIDGPSTESKIDKQERPNNRVLVVKPHFKTLYELFRGRKPTLSFMRPFGCQVTIHNTLDHLEKFDGKSDEGFFVCYSTNSKAIRVYNTRTRKGHPKLGLWYPKDSSFDLVAYTDSDYDGASLDRKSTSRGCQFLGSRLISWQCKKKIVVATSTTEAEYAAVASYCGQVLWIQN
nr:hypothetical protein [Tanacetum cinerariifolium]